VAEAALSASFLVAAVSDRRTFVSECGPKLRNLLLLNPSSLRSPEREISPLRSKWQRRNGCCGN